MSATALTARDSRLVNCHSCDLVSRLPAGSSMAVSLACPRCGAALHSRKPASLLRTWALLITAVICYIPANLLPMTRITSFGSVQEDTIMSGVVYFVQSGSWPIALVIFVASVFVPLLKIVILVILLLSIQARAQWRPRDRARLYRITERIGRWSMVDIYVVTILVALVKMGAIANVDAGPAALFFAAVVIITMLSAAAFDPRLIWDTIEPRPTNQNDH